MKKRLSILYNYYPFMFAVITMLYCVPIFPQFSKIFNVCLFILGIMFILTNIKKINFNAFYLELIFLVFVSLSIILGEKKYFISNMDKLALCFLEVIVLLHFSQISDNIEKNIKLIMKMQIGLSFTISLISIILYFANIHCFLFGFEIGNVGKDLVGFYTQPNTAGINAAISIIFSYTLYCMNKSNKKLLCFLAMNIILQSIIIVFSHSNASFLIVFSYGFLELCFFYSNKRKRKICMNCFIFIPNIESVASKLANGRFELWGYGYQIIKNHVWSGVSPAGVKSYAKYYAGITGPSRSIDKGGLHNSYIQLFASVGILGGVAAISLILKNLINAIRNHKEKSKYISLCVAILIYSIMESTLFFQSAFIPVVFWIFLGYSVSE